jgi:hypothetical protein
MRITTVLAVLPFLIVLSTYPEETKRQERKYIVAFLSGSAVGLIWPLYIILSAPKAFFCNAYLIPLKNGAWLHEAGMTLSKYSLVKKAIATPGYFSLSASVIILWVIIILANKKCPLTKRKESLLALLLALVFFSIAFVPPTMWLQYMAMPVPFLVISMAFPMAFLCQLAQNNNYKKYFRITFLAISVSGLISIISFPVVIYRLPLVFCPDTWTPIRLHRTSEEIADKVGKGGKILTLAPLFALEGGCEIYPELSCGPFVYRVGDLIQPDIQKITHTVGPKTVSQMLQTSMPDAVLLGAESLALETSLYVTAVQPTWEKITFENTGVYIYLRPVP